MFELSIKVVGEDQTLVEKHLVYEDGVTLSKDDAVLSKLVDDTVKKFHGPVDDVVLKIKLVW